MPSSDRAGAPSEGLQAFAAALRELHALAGRPSTRAMAGKLTNVSHTTVAEALNGKRVPSWSAVRGIVRLLGGNEERFRELWVVATAKPVTTGTEASANRDFLARYRRQVADYHGKLELPDFERRWRLPIVELYVPLRVRPAGSDTAAELDTWQFDEVISHTVLLGDPGGGKTTACHALMHRHAMDSERDIPFLVTLRDFAFEAAPTRSVVGYIESRLDTFYQCPSPPGLLEKLLRAGKALVIFDGLDELLDVAKRSEVTSIIELFCAEFRQACVLVTSRIVGYAQAQLDPIRFKTYLLNPLSQDQIIEYARKWFALREDHKSEAERYAKAFIKESRHVNSLMANPLLLALLCTVYRGEGYLPRNQPELYERIVRLLLYSWDLRRRVTMDMDARYLAEPALRYLAFWMFSRGDGGTTVTVRELIEQITNYLQQRAFDDRDQASEAACQLVDLFRGRAWMFTVVGTTERGEELYAFSHRMFLEYFAAAYLAVTSDSPEKLAHTIGPHVAHGEWEIVSQIALQIDSRNFELGADRAVTALLNEREELTPSEQANIHRFLISCLDLLQLSPRIVGRLKPASGESALRGVPHLDAKTAARVEKLGEVAYRHKVFIEQHGSMTRADSLAIRKQLFGGKVQATANLFGKEGSGALFWRDRPLGTPVQDEDPIRLTAEGARIAELWRATHEA